MKNHSKLKRTNRNDRGVALIISLLLLMLFTVMTLSMVIATTSDTLIDGYYRNARGSFYAADSGINAVRQYMINQLKGDVPSPFIVYSSSPMTLGQEGAIVTNIANSSTGFGSYQSILGSNSSWKGSFYVNYNAGCATTGGSGCPTFITPATCTVHYTSSIGTIPTCSAPGNGSATWYQFSYPYKITVTGQSAAGQANTIEEQGTLVTTVPISTTTTTNFAAWGMFIDQSPICNGSYLVPGTITGPVFTNGAWNFGTSGSYIFTDTVGSGNANIGYQFGSCIQSPNTSYTSGAQTIHPTFQSGVSLNQPHVNAPTDSFDQKQAIVDSVGASAATAATMNTLRNISGSNYISGTTTSGVYLPYTTSAGPCPCTNTFNGGGVYVEGNAAVTVTASGSTAQVYTIVQGGTTTTVTIDTAAGANGTTTVHTGGSPGTTTSINGVPVNLSTGVSQNATELYVDGNITGLTGGGQGVGTIQNNTALSIVAAGDVTITGDILYKSEPVTLTQSGSTPPDTLIPGNNFGQTLGIFTANGNINLNNSQSNGNLEIDASLAAISYMGSGGLVNTGNAINTLTIVGGRIQNTLQNINTTTRNVWFDRRYAQGGFAPPWFPSTNVTTTTTSPTPTVTANRTSWVNTSAQ